MLSAAFVAAVCVAAISVVAMRDLDVGTDTRSYAWFYESLGQGWAVTRLEPGFVLFSYALRGLGVGLQAYQGALFALLLLLLVASARSYFQYLGGGPGWLTFATAAVMLSLASPVFVNASINAIRQGLASFPVFAALLAFHRRLWWRFLLWGVLATSFHYSSALYLLCAPFLLLGPTTRTIIAAMAFAVYSTGTSQELVERFAPSVYAAVMDYRPGATYQSGTRLDFAAFSLFWYVVPLLSSRLIRSPFNERIKESASVYLALVLPFLLLGWGNYSNRYLLPAWMIASFLIAAVFFHSRVALLRDPLFLRICLIVACGAFRQFVSTVFVI